MSPASKKPLEYPIQTLGPAKIESHLPCFHFIEDKQKLFFNITSDIDPDINQDTPVFFEKAGPRQKLYFDPPKCKLAIVTCGGICPGINDVIRAIVMEAHHRYKVAGTIGIKYGLEGFIPEYEHDVMELTPESVGDIHEFGGTILGSSRGHQSPEEVVDSLERMNVSALFIIGGDGSMRAASAIQKEIGKRKLKLATIAVPKTIDNDIKYVSKTFGFDTAVQKATEAIAAGHIEALGAHNGVGLVKLMGRESGFIAAQATLALKEVNFVLIPEEAFDLHGPKGFLHALQERLNRRKHAVIVVAEGAGQDLCQASGQKDKSGNPILGDVCNVLVQEIKNHFTKNQMPLTLKFIDPSYIIRSVPANAHDRVYCGFLGQNAVHAAMAGKTNMMVSMMHDKFVHVPLSIVTTGRKRINTQSNYWQAVLGSTGQPVIMRDFQ